MLRLATLPTRPEMGAAAAAEAVALLRSRQEARVILASAPSQNEFLAALVAAPLDWSSITLFHMDEYAGMPEEHPASFRSYQREHVLARITPRAFHGLHGEAADLKAECLRYAALLGEGPIDLVCLGIGENGHLAFNDPPVVDFEDPETVKLVELDESCRRQQVHDGCFASLDEVPLQALTLTIPALLRAETMICVVPGSRKAEAVRRALEGPIDACCPASILRRHPQATLYLDRDSAALLARRPLREF